MIDVEVPVFDYVYQAVSLLTPAVDFQSVFTPQPPTLPHATLMEIDNATDQSTATSSGADEFATIAYEANVYAESKQACRTVMDTIDRRMVALNFTRLSMQFIPNLADEAIYRYTARYRAKANQDKTIFRI